MSTRGAASGAQVIERSIKTHGADAFSAMRKAGTLAAEVLDALTPMVEPGVTTDALDRFCHDYIVDHGAVPAPLGYRGYPKSICTSVNHVVCHGIPGDKRLQKGDMLNIDVTVILDGWHGDTSRMFYVGQPSVKARRLIDITYEAMMRGIAAVRPGARLGDIGHAIQSYAEGQRCAVVRDFCGHGIGRIFHDAPNVLHYGEPGTGAAAQARHVLHRRAHDQSRRLAGEAAQGRLDRGDQGPLALSPVRAHDWCDRGRSRDIHALPARAHQATL